MHPVSAAKANRHPPNPTQHQKESPISTEMGLLSFGNRRSPHYAPPDFLLRLVALANFMRLSLLKAAHAVVSSAAWQEIRVRFGRDDKVAWKQCLAFPNKIVISTGA